MSDTPKQAPQSDYGQEEFSIDELRETGFTDAEIKALSIGTEDDPALIVMEDPDDSDANTGAGNEALIGGQPQAATLPPQAQAPMPTVEIPDTTEAEAVVAKLDARMEEIQEQYDNGEMTKAELIAQTKALVAEQTQANIIIQQAQSAITTTKQSAEKIFYAAQDEYYKAGAADLMSEAHLPAWDRHLREVTGNTAFAKLGPEQLIRLAHKRYADEYQVIYGTALPIAMPSAAPATAKLERRTDPRPDAPQTLANVNGDVSAAMGDSRKSVIDKLAGIDPLKAEAQLEIMAQNDPNAYEEYLRYA